MKKFLTLLMSTLIVGCSTATPSTAPSTAPSSEPTAATPAIVESVEIAALKGPTAMGLAGMSGDEFVVNIYASADEITPKLLKGELSAAAIPVNLAAVLNSKTEGKVKIAAINTYGVLYLVETGESIQNITDVKGKTIYATGQGTVPEYTLRHILLENGIDPDSDVTLEFCATPDEVAALLAEGVAEIAMLPEPFVTVAKTKNEHLRTALSLSELYKALHGTEFVTGVLAVNEEIYADQEKLDALIAAYEASVAVINGEDVATAAQLVAALGIVPAPVAEKALANCAVSFVTGAEMEAQVLDYLTILHTANPQSVGGKLSPEALFVK